MDVLSLLIKRTQYPIGLAEKDYWLDEIINSEFDEVAIVLPEYSLNQAGFYREDSIALREKYYLKAMFDLKNPYSNKNVSFFLYIFNKRENNTVLYGIYKESFKQRQTRSGLPVLPGELPTVYFEYIGAIEDFLKSGICPNDTESYEFGSFSSQMLEERRWTPNRYSKMALKVREALSRETTIPLRELATIIMPRPDTDNKNDVYRATPATWQYPVNYENFRKGTATDCVLQQGDIVIHDAKNLFLVHETLAEEVHTGPNFFVIRPNKDICPEYLYYYLTSDTAQIVMDSVAIGPAVRRIRRADLENLRIIVPQKSAQYYKLLFYAEKFAANDFSTLGNTFFSSLPTTPAETVEDILSVELINNLRICRDEIKAKILDEDVREINTCFKHGAYKAALILAGSVLEAVLIDWLSELHGKNYFEETYFDYKGREGNLAIYIRDIKYLKRPGWINEAEKADKIRDRRNQVHAKLCLKSDEITEELCKEVIGYLVDVLKTRNKKRIPRKL